MKYYVYISDTKVDMLLPQIPESFKKRVALDLGIEISILGAKLKGSVKRDPMPDERVARLQTVVRYLERKDLVGTVQEPKDFFHAIESMKWGATRYAPDAALFASYSNDAVVAMFGSVQHVLGEVATLGEPQSSIPYMVRNLLVDGSGRERAIPEPGVNSLHVLGAAVETVREYEGAEQSLEYVARPYWSGMYDHRWVVVGSPLYVALA